MASWISTVKSFLLAVAQPGLHFSGANTDLSHDDYIMTMSQEFDFESSVFYGPQQSSL